MPTNDLLVSSWIGKLDASPLLQHLYLSSSLPQVLPHHPHRRHHLRLDFDLVLLLLPHPPHLPENRSLRRYLQIELQINNHSEQ